MLCYIIILSDYISISGKQRDKSIKQTYYKRRYDITIETAINYKRNSRKF